MGRGGRWMAALWLPLPPPLFSMAAPLSSLPSPPPPALNGARQGRSRTAGRPAGGGAHNHSGVPRTAGALLRTFAGGGGRRGSSGGGGAGGDVCLPRVVGGRASAPTHAVTVSSLQG